jgi:DNA polymerase III subunit delta
MIYLFLKADEYLVAQRIAALKMALGDPEMADLNTKELDGSQIDAAEILYHANTMPFLCERRLVLVYGYLSYLDGRMAASKGTDSAAHVEAARLLQGLSDAPDNCDLVLVDDEVDRRRHLWKGFHLGDQGDTVVGLGALVKDKRVHLEKLATPEPRALPGWIQSQARHKGVEIDGQAVRMLADFVGSNLRQLDNELEKLAVYAGSRRVTAEDVRLLVSDAGDALIWDLTDALSQRNGRKAMQTLYELRRGDANPFYLLTMIARQYRIMAKVKEAMQAGGDPDAIARRVAEKPYPVQKAMQQSRQYSSQDLDAIMERLLEADVAMKTGADADTEIDVLVAELTRR